MSILRFLLLAAVLLPALPARSWIAYIGTYTNRGSKGIYGYRFDDATGKLTPFGVAAETESPSFLAVHPNQKFLYAVNEVSTFKGQPAGAVSAFTIDPKSGQLKLINQVSSRRPGPCHLALDKAGKWLFVANYNGGSTAAYPVHPDGSLGEASAFVQHSGSSVNRQRQAGPHAHSATLSPDQRLVLVADLGLDQILEYRIDPAKGTLSPNEPPFAKVAPGSGPRHTAFRPDGKFLYAINEMLSTVTAFRYSPGGAAQEVQTISTLPADFKGNSSTAEIVVDRAGQFLYGSNRGHDSIAIFRIDKAKGTLTAAGHVPTQGRTPRNFAIDPSGKYLIAANQDGNNLVEFRIDRTSGGLTPAGVTLEVSAPVCVVFAAAR